MAAQSHKPANTGTALPRYVGIEQICTALGVSRSTLDRDRKDGKFPPHTKIRGRVVWPADAVSKYVESRAATHIPAPATHNGPTAFPADYSSRFQTVFVGIDGTDHESLLMLCEAIEIWLRRHGIKGCAVVGSLAAGAVAISWHPNLGHAPDRVLRCLRRLERDIEEFDDSKA